MAQILTATIYGANSNDWNTPDGVVMGFPTSQIVIRAISPTSYSGVTCNSQIQLLPTAPSVIQPVYYTDAEAADLIADANA
jgi:hypothetical protein